MPKQKPNRAGSNDEMDDFELDEDQEFDADEDDDDDDSDDAVIDRLIAKHIKKNNAVVNNRMDTLEHRMDNVEKMVKNLAGLEDGKKKRSAIIADADDERTGVDRFLDMTLGTAGRALHAVVDTVAFVGESAVDIVTLGRAKQR